MTNNPLMYVTKNYKNNPRGKKWTITRKLTSQLNNKLTEIKYNQGQSVWKEFARPNGPLRDIKEKIRIHNWRVRKSWKRPRFNKRERVMEVYNNYVSGLTTVKHVDSEGAVKEKTFTTQIINDRQNHNLAFDRHIFGDSELHVRSLDTWNNYEGFDPQDYNNAIDFLTQLLA